MSLDTRSKTASELLPESRIESLGLYEALLSGSVSYSALALLLEAAEKAGLTSPSQVLSSSRSTGPFDRQFGAVVDLIEDALEASVGLDDYALVAVSSPQAVSAEWQRRIAGTRAIEHHPGFEIPDYGYE